MTIQLGAGTAIQVPAPVSPGFRVDAQQPPAGALKDIAIDELSIRLARSRDDIRQMARMRQQIDLAAATSIDPQFAEHEKKETNWAWSSLSS